MGAHTAKVLSSVNFHFIRVGLHHSYYGPGYIKYTRLVILHLKENTDGTHVRLHDSNEPSYTLKDLNLHPPKSVFRKTAAYASYQVAG